MGTNNPTSNVTIRTIIRNGKSANGAEDYIQDFAISAVNPFVPVTGITMNPASITVTPSTVTATVAPGNATTKSPVK